MKKYVVILSLLFCSVSFADTSQGLEKLNNAVTQTDNVNSTLERTTGVLDRLGSIFKKKKKSSSNSFENSNSSTDNSSSTKSVDEIKESVKESVKQQDSSSNDKK